MLPQVEYAYSDNSLDPGECLPPPAPVFGSEDTPPSAL